MFENLEAVGRRPWRSCFQSGLSWLFCGLVLPVKLRGGVTSFAPRSWVDREIERRGTKSIGRFLGEAEAVIEERFKLALDQTTRRQLELPFEKAPAAVEELQPSLWPEGLGSRATFTAVNKISTGCGPSVDERDFLGIVASPAFEESRHRTQRLELRNLSVTQEAFRRALVDASTARASKKIRWGEERCVDALRLRYVGHIDWKRGDDRSSIEDAAWLGALEWLGKRITEAEGLRKAPRNTLRVLATSIAASSGYGRSLEWVRTLPDKDRCFSWRSLLALRSLFDGGMSPDVISSLIPPSFEVTRKVRGDSTWLPLSLALRWAIENRSGSGLRLVGDPGHGVSAQSRERRNAGEHGHWTDTLGMRIVPGG